MNSFNEIKKYKNIYIIQSKLKNLKRINNIPLPLTKKIRGI